MEFRGYTITKTGYVVQWPNDGDGYALPVQAVSFNPTNGQTIYFGSMPKAPTTTPAISKMYIRKPGTIRLAEIYSYAVSAGGANAWTLSIRLNNTTDYDVATVSAATNERVFTNASLNIPVVAGDYVEIKLVNPTWTGAPPTGITFGGYIFIDEI